jgi:hypothetical protein
LLEDPLDHRPQAFRQFHRGLLVEPVDRLGEAVVDELEDQSLLGREVPVQGARSDLGRRRDLLDRRPAEPVVAEQLESLVRDQPAGPLPLHLAQSHQHLRGQGIASDAPNDRSVSEASAIW